MLSHERRTNRARILFFLAVLHMLCHALLTLITPLYVSMQRDFGLARVEPITSLLTWMLVTFSLATLLAGQLCDRLPGRWIAGGGLLLHGAGLIGLSFAPTVPWARFWVVVAGIGASGYHPVSVRQIVGLFPEAVGRAMGLAAIGAAVGFYVGPRFAGWRAGLAGWRAPMLEAGAIAILVAVLFLILTAEPTLHEQPVKANGVGNHRRNKVFLVGAIGLLGLFLIPRDFAGLAYDSLHALFLEQAGIFRLDVAGIGALLGAKGLISLVSNPLFAWVSDRGHRLWWWAGTLLASAFCGAVVPWLPADGAKVALVLQGMFFLANYPIFEAALVERVPARIRGRAYALILAIVGIFSAFAPKFVGGQVDALLATASATDPVTYRGLYLGLAVTLLTSLVAIALLQAVQTRTSRLES